MLKIAIIVPEYLPVPAVSGGGVETLITDFLELNEKLKRYKFDVFSIANKQAEESAQRYKLSRFIFNEFHSELFGNFVKRISHKLFSQNLLFNKKYFLKVLEQLTDREYDYILVENKAAVLPLLKQVLNKRKNASKVILHIHNVDQIRPSIWVNLCDQCDGVITVSNYVKKLILDEYPQMDENRIAIVRNFSDLKLCPESTYLMFKRDFYRKHSIAPKDRIILYSGRVIESKGIKQLMNALETINNKHVHLIVIGTSWYSRTYKTSFEKEIFDKAKKIPGKVIFTGYIPHEKIGKYYALADICVFPSVAPETAGLVQLEAMGQKKMTIISNSGGMPEYIGDTGIIVDLGKNFQNDLTEKINYTVKLSEEDLLYRGNELYKHSLAFSKKRSFESLSTVLEDWRR